MRREGRLHGMVRTYPILSSPLNPRPNPRNLKEVRSPPTAGLFNKVSTKPTNHSKFTGKCGRANCRDCHIHPPAGKSKDKSKGSKIRTLSQSGFITGLINWRVVDANPVYEFTGHSASGMLGYLASDDDFADRDCEIGYVNDCDGNGEVEELYYDNEVSSGVVEIEEIDDREVNGVDDDDQLSLYEVGFDWQQVDGEDESWCLVEDISDLGPILFDH